MANEHVNLDVAAERIEAGRQAADTYIEKLESVRDELSSDANGATLGTMVAAQLKMTEIETQYVVEVGMPKKASAAHLAAANEVKKTTG
mgnify:FL=1